MNISPTDETILSTWDQVGEGGWAISPVMAFAKFSAKKYQVGWKLWRRQGYYEVIAHEVMLRDYAEGANAGSKQAVSKKAVVVLMQQAEDITGVSATGWVRNGLGDYVPREVNKARPLRKVD